MDEQIKKLGEGFYYGLSKFAKKTFLLAAFCYGVVVIIGLAGGRFDYDSTDNGKKRSGLSLMVDAQTGCHYLSAGGGITPRISRSGVHICNGKQAKNEQQRSSPWIARQ